MDRHHLCGVITLMAAVAVGGAGLTAAPAAWGASHLKKDMTRTGSDPDARGRASLVVRGMHGKLGVKVAKLAGGSTFEVTCDTVRIGELTTSGGGRGRARFSTRPHGRDQILGMDPRGKLLTVRDEDGEDVLEVEMPDDNDPADIRCCLADDEETECEDRTPEECDAEGGMNLGEGSCMPNPCPTVPPGEEIVCCTPDHDEDGPECETSTPAECSEEDGVNLGPGQCEPNPCGPTPPPEEEIRCCIADDDELEENGGHSGPGGGDNEGEGNGEDGPECERETAAECDARGGTNLGPGSCEPNPCAASPSGAFLDGMAGLL